MEHPLVLYLLCCMPLGADFNLALSRGDCTSKPGRDSRCMVMRRTQSSNNTSSVASCSMPDPKRSLLRCKRNCMISGTWHSVPCGLQAGGPSLHGSFYDAMCDNICQAGNCAALRHQAELSCSTASLDHAICSDSHKHPETTSSIQADYSDWTFHQNPLTEPAG